MRCLLVHMYFLKTISSHFGCVSSLYFWRCFCTFFSCVWPTGGPIVSLFFCVSMTGWASLCRVPHFSSLHSCELTSHCVIAAEASLIQWTVYWGSSDELSDAGRVRSAHYKWLRVRVVRTVALRNTAATQRHLRKC